MRMSDIGRRTLTLFLTLALCANQAFALTAAGFIGVWEGEQQRLSFWWQTSGWAKTLTALPLRLTGQMQSSGRPETQADRDARVHTLKIQPDNVTAQPGQHIVFQAVAYDFNGNAIPGVKFEWSANDEGRKEPATVTPQGEFRVLVDGTYKVTAHALGRQTQVIVKVVGEPFKPRKPEEIPSGTVSTRDLPPAKSDTSLNHSRYQQSQIARKTTQPNARGTLTGPSKPTLKAAAGALTTTAAFQLWGDPYGWTDLNYMSADDCGKEVGDPPGRLVDNGAGSGNHQFTAPILNLEGRNLDLGLALSYNGRVWHKANNEITFDIDRDWPAPGFSLGFGKITQTGLSHGFLLIDGDGTRHGYQCQSNATGMTCFTNDGSFVDYDVVTTSSPFANTPISATAKMADGTIITYGSPATYAVYPTKIMDRHGNYLTISYVNDQGPRINQITDTLGRVVTFHYDTANCLTAITAPDFSTGTTRTLVRLNYSDLTLTHNYTSNPVPKVRMSSFKMLKAIYYPATATGYWFGGSGDYSGYGMLTKVCEQRGMGFDNSTALTSPGTITAGTMSHEMSYVYNAPSTIEPMYTEMREKWAGMETGTGTPGYDATTGSAKTTFQIVEESGQSRRSTRITRPDGTIHVQWQYANPGQFNDGLIFYDKTCAPGATCLFDAVGTDDSPGLRGSSVSWESGNNGAPRPWALYTYYRPWENLAGQQSNLKLTRLFYGSWNNQVTKTDEYNYEGILIRTSTTQYETASSYLDRHIFNLPKIVEVKEGSVVKQKTEYVYDIGALLSNAPNVVQHDVLYDPQNFNYDPLTDFRGLVTQVKRYPTIGSTTGMVIESRTYDETGNLLTAATSCCEQTTLTYSSNNQYAYPATQTRGSASDPNTQITTSAVYNMYTGLVTKTNDANNRETKRCYLQSNGTTPGTLRLWREESPTGALLEYAYDDLNLTVTTTAYASISGKTSDCTGTGAGVGSKNIKTLDGAGRVVSEVAYGAAMVQDKVDTKYDGLGRVWKQTRPYRAGDTPQWYENFYDPLDRLMKVCSTINGQTETLVEKFYDETTVPTIAPTGKGNTLRTKDAWGRERWARFDWADRLCEIVEPDAAGSGSVASGGTLTKYSYDCLNNLAQVDQNVVSGVAEQTRKFKYDALSRLTHQKLAERDGTLNEIGGLTDDPTGPGGVRNWSDYFEYDTRSNLTRHIDARGVKTNFTYNNDPLNRLQSVSYDKTNALNATNIIAAATVTYQYMTSGDRTRLLSVADGCGTDEFAYDVEGRLCETKRTFTNRGAYPVQVNYLFDTLDRLYQMTYPAQYGQTNAPRRVETMTFDEASRINGLTYDSISRASAITYNAASQTTALNIGNNVGSQLSESYTYEPATGLLSNQKVQRQGTGTPLLDQSYEYTKYGTTVGRTGQLTKIVNNKDTTKSKYYDYDALGRLKTLYSFTNGNNPMTTNQWTQAYTYDRFGNRTGVSKTGSISVTDGLAALSFTATSGTDVGKVKTNRITTANYEYDEAGNQTRGQVEGASPGTFVWQRFQYDAAGRLACTKADDNTTVLASYNYGASNRRLKQVEGSTTCYYAWDGNSILAEYNDTGSALNWTKSYVYLGGRLLATQTPSATNYHHPDRLGTRLVTSGATAIEQNEQATLPYGTALDAESWGTATNQRFTSYDRSQQTKLDYAVNRFYSASQGRFTQVDPIGMRAASLSNPQSLNLYAYVGGDPINRIDPTGLFWGFIGKVFKSIAKAFAIALLVAAVLIVTLTDPIDGALLAKTLIGAGIFGLIGWGKGKLAKLASAFVGVGSRSGNFRTPGINGNATGGVSTFLQQSGRSISKEVEQRAIWGLQYWLAISIEEGVEYAGAICRKASGALYSAIERGTRTEGSSASCLEGSQLVARWHTHPQKGGELVDPNNPKLGRFSSKEGFSESDMTGANLRGVPSYVAERSGRIYRFDPAFGRAMGVIAGTPEDLLKGNTVPLTVTAPTTRVIKLSDIK